MFNKLRSRIQKLFPDQNGDGKKDFVFVWYRQMTANGKVHFTAPYRTTVRAKNIVEAKAKLTAIVEKRMKLVIVTEEEYKKTGLSQLHVSMEKFRNNIENIFRDIENTF